MRRPASRTARTATCGALLGLGACGGPSDPEVPAPEPKAAAPEPSQPSGPKVRAEVGALDPEATDAVVDAIRAEVGSCFEQANASIELPVVGGDLDVVVRVASDGSTRWVYPSASDVGHAGVHRCIVELHEKADWPKPEGGEEGIATTHFGRDPSGRAPVAWTAADLGPKGEALAGELSRCAREAGAQGLSVTFYVDRDGQVMAAGASTSDESGIDALDCAVEAARSEVYPSPGSYPAKVTIESW